jgi:hypothetical protein
MLVFMIVFKSLAEELARLFFSTREARRRLHHTATKAPRHYDLQDDGHGVWLGGDDGEGFNDLTDVGRPC